MEPQRVLMLNSGTLYLKFSLQSLHSFTYMHRRSKRETHQGRHLEPHVEGLESSEPRPGGKVLIFPPFFNLTNLITQIYKRRYLKQNDGRRSSLYSKSFSEQE